MNSEEINKKLRELDGKDDLPFVSFGGKPVPYLGWFWRTVNFDDDRGCSFGAIPAGVDDNDSNLIGFMQNNKWGYPTVYAKREQWANIKALIVTALEDMTADNFRAVNDAIQLLGAGKKFYYDPYEE